MSQDSKFVRCFSTIMIACQIAGNICSAQTISPSSKTRTFSAPKDNYYHQITKGHPTRWFERDMAIRVLIEPGKDVPHFQSKYEEILRQSFQEWESISKSKIKFQYVTEGPADICCQFVSELPKTKEFETQGQTQSQISPHHVDFAQISIKTNSERTGGMTDKLMHTICLHEIGHALGLSHHSLDPHDVMYAYSTNSNTLSQRDINTINLLYEFDAPEKNTTLTGSGQHFYPSYPARLDGNIPLSSVEYDTFTKVVAAKLLKHNKALPSSPMLECRISFLADSKGNISNYRIFESSGNDQFDEKTVSSLISSLPLPPAPEKLLQNSRKKVPVAFNFRSDGWVVPYIEPDPQHSDWFRSIDEPTPQDLLKDLEKDKSPSAKVLEPGLEPWIIAVTQKAQAAWKASGKGKAEIIIGIRNDGRIAHLLIVNSSKNEPFDKSALDACVAGEPYPPAPNTADTTELNMLFEN